LTKPHYPRLVTSGERKNRSESYRIGSLDRCLREEVARYVSSCHRSFALDRESIQSSTQESSHINRSRAPVGSALGTSQPLYNLGPPSLISQGVGHFGAFLFLDVLELTQCRKVTPLQTENFSFCIILLHRDGRLKADSIPYHVSYAPPCYSRVSLLPSFSLAQEKRTNG